jgi:hypothetical protein
MDCGQGINSDIDKKLCPDKINNIFNDFSFNARTVQQVAGFYQQIRGLCRT